MADEGPSPTGAWSIEQGKAWLRERLRKGAACPLCTQRAQVYRRSINTGMARSLVQMHLAAGLEWQHVPTSIGARSREEGKLAYWSLVAEADEEREDGGRAGWWRVTPLGKRFVLEGLAVDRYALVYDGKVLGTEGGPWTIRDALGSRFDLERLLAGEG